MDSAVYIYATCLTFSSIASLLAFSRRAGLTCQVLQRWWYSQLWNQFPYVHQKILDLAGTCLAATFNRWLALKKDGRDGSARVREGGAHHNMARNTRRGGDVGRAIDQPRECRQERAREGQYDISALGVEECYAQWIIRLSRWRFIHFTRMSSTSFV